VGFGGNVASLGIMITTKDKNILSGTTTATNYNQSGIPTMLVISSKLMTTQNRIYLILLIYTEPLVQMCKRSASHKRK